VKDASAVVEQRKLGGRSHRLLFLRDGSVALLSYKTIVARKFPDGAVWLYSGKWDCSATTNKYRVSFLGESTAATRAKVQRGVYRLAKMEKVEVVVTKTSA
jgi:hypothetical protein